MLKIKCQSFYYNLINIDKHKPTSMNKSGTIVTIFKNGNEAEHF